MHANPFLPRCALGLALVAATCGSATAQSPAARAYCEQGGRGEVATTPPELIPLQVKTFGIDASLARKGTYVRCVGSTLMGCSVGANLVCGKADSSRNSAGATAFCRDNPSAGVVPMAATGHGTIYDWSCKAGRAVAGKILVRVDRQGYIAENWRAIR